MISQNIFKLPGGSWSTKSSGDCSLRFLLACLAFVSSTVSCFLVAKSEEDINLLIFNRDGFKKILGSPNRRGSPDHQNCFF